MRNKILLALGLFLSLSLTAQANFQIKDVSYKFDKEKNKNIETEFMFFRSYVDYFYLLLKNNSKELAAYKETMKYSGYCVGDAHPENFGFIIQNSKTTVFTMNDMDDFGACPLFYDLVRFATSSQFLDQPVELEQLIVNYKLGLIGEDQEFPKVLKKLEKDSLKKGAVGSPKKVQNKLIVRAENTREVDAKENEAIINTIAGISTFKDFKIIDRMASSKVSGGSAGLQRYSVLLEKQDELLLVEFKELGTPAIKSVATASLSDNKQRIQKALEVEQGANHSKYYSVQNVLGKDMLIRPLFRGNEGIDLKDMSQDEQTAVALYEAQKLGLIHAKSAQPGYVVSLNKISDKDLKQLVQSLVVIYKERFSKLKAQN